MNRQERILDIVVLLLGVGLLVASCAPLPGPATSPLAPPAIPGPDTAPMQARAALAAQLGIAQDEITVVSAEPVEWPDACLGLPQADEMCAQVITPGYRIVLEARGGRYIAHTDQTGGQVRLAPAEAASPLPDAAAAAAQVLVRQLGIPLSVVRLVSMVEVVWRDGCLELAGPDEMCTLALVPGYRIILEATGQQYVFHTNRSGSQVRMAAASIPEKEWPRAALRARNALAEKLGLAPEAVRIISAEAVDWPDACLGIYLPDEGCAQVLTPGFKVILEANGIRYEYHTDQNGDALRPLPVPLSAAPADVIWRGTTGTSECVEARLTPDALTYGPCDGTGKTVPLTDERGRPSQLVTLLMTYRPFAAATPAGSVSFAGQGRFQATPAEQRMIAEWLTQVVAEAHGEPGMALWGLSWHREGGLAGFCDELAIDSTGYAELSTCRGPSSTVVAVRWLTADELAQFYIWLDALKPFEFVQQDPATADALTVRYLFAGRGSREATEAEKQAIAQFGTDVLARWPAPSDVQSIQTLAETAIYAGPAEQYPVLGRLSAGQTLPVTGIHPDSTWWRVMCPDETIGNCWVSADPTVTRPAPQ